MIRRWLLALLLPTPEVQAHTHCPDCGLTVPIEAVVVGWEPVLEVDTTEIEAHIVRCEESS